MNKSWLKNILIILLASLTAISVFRYLGTLKDNFQLQERLAQVKVEINALTQEKQNALQELEKEKQIVAQSEQLNFGLKDYLKAGKRRLGRLFQDYTKVQNELSDTQAKFSILKAENTALIEDRKKLDRENQEFKAKLSSIDILKGILRELKMKMYKPPKGQLEGNRGFIIKDGKATIGSKVKIEVIPGTKN